MKLEFDPPLEPSLADALQPLVLAALRSRDERHPALASEWWRAAVRESVENDPPQPG